MKFGRLYKEHLENDGYPPEWIESAVSYGQLKKCIKRVQKELSDIGLDIETLSRLLKSVEASNDDAQNGLAPMQYSLNDTSDECAFGRRPFQPKLLIALDDVTGEPLDIGLAPETKSFLRQLASQQRQDGPPGDSDAGEDTSSLESLALPTEGFAIHRAIDSRRVIEVALTSDSEFFAMLQGSLSALEDLQTAQQSSMTAQIHTLGSEVANVAQPVGRFHRTDMDPWRKIFEMYLDHNIFFATGELDHGTHDFEKARKQWLRFTAALKESMLLYQFKKKESSHLLATFLRLNDELLKAQHFRELNSIATTKILKKFDKRTALPIVRSSTLPTGLTTNAKNATALPSQALSKAICAEFTTQLLTLIPQLPEYTCPVCMDITWKPVKLSCNHIFCIQCLVVLQREHKDLCPLCRVPCVERADSENIDWERGRYLKKWFPTEVRAKQRDNERKAAIEQFGEEWVAQYQKSGPCTVM